MRPTRPVVSAAFIALVALGTAACSTTTSASTSAPTSTAPNVVTVSAGAAYATTSIVSMRYRSLPSSAYIDTGEATVNMLEVAVGQSAVLSGTTFRAATGERLVADQIQAFPDGANGELSGFGFPAPVGSLVVNGLTERVINLNTSLNSVETAPTTLTIFAAIPRKGRSAWLSITQAGLSQTISLLTGTRGAQDPPVLYRNDSVGLSGSYTLPYTMAGTYVGSPASTTITITGAQLSWFPVGIGNTTPTPTSTGDAWLTLNGSTTSSGFAGNPVLSGLNMPLVLPDGTSIPATMLLSVGASGSFTSTNATLFGDGVGWEVPSSFTKGVITVTPGNNLQSGYAGTVDNYGTANAIIPVSIPNSPASAGGSAG